MTERVQGIFQVQNTMFSWGVQRAEAGESLSLCAWHAKLGWVSGLQGSGPRLNITCPVSCFLTGPLMDSSEEGVNAPRPVFPIKSMLLDRERPLLGSSRQQFTP